MKHDLLPIDEFAALYQSVSRFPEPLNAAEFMNTIKESMPESVRGSNQVASVIVSIWVNADGSVRSARAVVPERPKGVTLRGIKTDERGRYLGDIPPATADPECMQLAERAAHVLRFRPAERNGQPVNFPDLRLGVDLSGQARRSS